MSEWLKSFAHDCVGQDEIERRPVGSSFDLGDAILYHFPVNRGIQARELSHSFAQRLAIISLSAGAVERLQKFVETIFKVFCALQLAR